MSGAFRCVAPATLSILGATPMISRCYHELCDCHYDYCDDYDDYDYGYFIMIVMIIMTIMIFMITMILMIPMVIMSLMIAMTMLTIAAFVTIRATATAIQNRGSRPWLCDWHQVCGSGWQQGATARGQDSPDACGHIFRRAARWEFRVS